MVTNHNRIKIIFFLSFIYTVSIIALTFSITYYFDQLKIKEVLYDYRYELLELNEYDVSLLYVDMYRDNIADYCNYSISLFDSLDDRIRDLGTKLSRYGQSSTALSEQDYDYLKRKYYLILLKEYYLLWTLKKRCANVNTALFFFKKDDENSLVMGQVYSEVSRRIPNTYILSFDVDYKDIALLDVIKSKYNITPSLAPVIIFNDKCIIHGKKSVDEILSYLEEKMCIL